MRVTECSWDLISLNKSTAEVIIERGDAFISELIEKLNSSFQYVVIKVPMSMPSFNRGLSSMAFTLIETQIKISKKYTAFDFEDKLIKPIYTHTSVHTVKTQEDLEAMLSRITEDMFSTDRIALDPSLGPGLSRKRYTNWIRTEFFNKTADVYNILYDDEIIGFSLSKTDNNSIVHGLLGGIFKEYQASGLGMVTAGIHFFDAKKKNTPFSKFITTISSNNVPMLQLYNYLGFKVDDLSYVFVKHNA